MTDMTRIETKPGPWNITDPDWPTYTHRIPNAIITSDTFASGDPTIPGRLTDAVLGGTPMTWGADVADRYAVQNGALTSGTATGISATGIAHPQPDIRMSFTLATTPQGSTANETLWADLWRSGHPSDYGGHGYRLALDPRGTATLQKRNPPEIPGNVNISDAFPIQDGDTFVLTIVADTLTLGMNGTEVASETVTEVDRTVPGFTGFSTHNDTAGFRIENFLLRQIDQPDLLA